MTSMTLLEAIEIIVRRCLCRHRAIIVVPWGAISSVRGNSRPIFLFPYPSLVPNCLRFSTRGVEHFIAPPICLHLVPSSLQVHQRGLRCHEADIEELRVCDKVQHRQPHPNRRRGHLEGGEVGRFYFLEVAVLDKVITVALCI